MKAEQGAMPSSSPPQKGPNCWECRYLAITWDVRMPYGCKLMGFRSKVVPSLEVLRTDGRFCGGFSPKANPEATKKPSKTAKKPVGNSSQRRETDPRRPIYHINLIT
jgi:hypothetical protein